jgi:hypothetical protein
MTVSTTPIDMSPTCASTIGIAKRVIAASS